MARLVLTGLPAQLVRMVRPLEQTELPAQTAQMVRTV
jgi:hypothetical protein